jgi:hypothetical protein
MQNYAAHECATYVRRVGVSLVWLDSFPDTIAKALALDCNQSPGII